MLLLSCLNWYNAPTQPFLPDPNKEGSHEAVVSCEAANEEIEYHLVASSPDALPRSLRGRGGG